MTAHCGVEDPAAAKGDERTKEAAFAKAFHELRNRIAIFVDLPLEWFSTSQLKEKLGKIGRVALANPGPEEMVNGR
jgi:arsenate reductase